jgi:hypothetical protein
MAIFAVIKNGVVENAIVADARAIAEAILSDVDGEIVEETSETGTCFVGCGFDSGKFMTPQPYASWTFDKKSWNWVAPKKCPTMSEGKRGVWNEETGDWEAHDVPQLVEPDTAD